MFGRFNDGHIRPRSPEASLGQSKRSERSSKRPTNINPSTADSVVSLTSNDLNVGAGLNTNEFFRLNVTSNVDVQVLAYVKHSDGFLTTAHDLLPTQHVIEQARQLNFLRDGRHASTIRLLNLSDTDVLLPVSDFNGVFGTERDNSPADVRAEQTIMLNADEL